MSVVIKYKLSDVAKDLNVQNKELIDFLYQTLGESKKHTSPLTEAELNHVFEHYTQKNSEASLVKLNNILFESKSRSRLAIERLALESLEYSFGGRCATVYLTKEQIAETGADGTDLEGITSLPRMIEGVEVGITIRQQPTGSYKVSVRTVTGVDASAICAHLGGGGHKQAAGCELLGSLDNAKAALLTEVEKALCKES